MIPRLALLAGASLATAFGSYALFSHWGAEGHRDLAALIRGVQHGE
jgi:hypothetical protein